MSTIRTARQVRAGDSTPVISAYFTMIVPVMNGCIEQWYATVPTVENVWVKVWPFASADEVKELSARGLPHWAGPGRRRPGETNVNDGGRGVHWEDPSGHFLEITTRPYGGGG